MNRIYSSFVKLFAALLIGLGSLGSASAAPITQLGFALDGSGSVSTTDYNLLRSGLSSAMAVLPTDGSVEITIVTFGTSVATVVSPTVLSLATLPTIQTAISTHVKSGGLTNTAGAITSLTGLMTGSSLFSTANNSIINLATDGLPTLPGPDSQAAAVAASAAAAAAGIDALSIEAIGFGVSNPTALSNMAAMAFPTPVAILPVNSTTIPNPIGGSFVVPVSDFTAFPSVIQAKVVAAVTPPQVPEPASLVLVGIGMGMLGTFFYTRRRRN